MGASKQYVCQSCGFIAPKWAGRCEGCGMWNSFVEETADISKTKKKGARLHFTSLKETAQNPLQRMCTHIQEFDRVCGGGLVPGSVVLLGGDPGIGKSTLLLQVSAALSRELPCGYISGEEGLDQVRMRSQRLGLSDAPLKLASSTYVEEVIQSLEQEHLALAVVDSIQTMSLMHNDAPPGTVSQIRSASHELIRAAKKYGVILILVGHVTKDGALAGPKLLEHMVDTVLYFEGERGHPFRILRAQKNRFGPSDELGVFDMTETGLHEVPNPSALFLSHRDQNATGSVVFPGIEGTRPLLAEIQTLASPSYLPSPRRSVVGWDHGRLSMVVAILETRAGLHLSQKDIYLSVVGGLKLSEPAADLAVAAALISCIKKTPLPNDVVIFGELSLSGDVRPVTQMEARLKEAAKLGFTQALMPVSKKKKTASSTPPKEGLRRTPITHIKDLIQWIEGLA
ncbi:DNA repair protein RadA [bacterium NHP-B]|nr:DNA repair protein RadA [bacterium NHP-B]